MAARAPGGVARLLTALRFHNLTTFQAAAAIGAVSAAHGPLVAVAAAAVNFVLVSAAFEGGRMLGSLFQAAVVDPLFWDMPPCNCP